MRWIGAAQYSSVGGWPGLPAGAAGALVYLFAAPADRGTAHAIQVEAVDGAGGRLVGWRHWDRADSIGASGGRRNGAGRGQVNGRRHGGNVDGGR